MLMRTLILMAFAITCFTSNAQRLSIKNYSIGYRTFGIDGVGNNPTTIAPFLKDPWTYQNFLNQIHYNSLWGNPGVQLLHDYCFNVELSKNSPDSRFWKKHTIQLGVFISNQSKKGNMALANERVVISSNDTTLFVDKYSIVQKQQFAGINAGINKRIILTKQLQFLTGFHLQGGIAFLHRYNQQLDSSNYYHQNWTTKTTKLPDLKGRNFFQWRAMIPLGVELNAYKKEIFIRAELDLGIAGDRYRKESFANKEAHGYGVWLIYKPKR